MKISELSVIFVNNQLIYHLRLPLLGYARYTLYKASPWPTPQPSLQATSVFAYIFPEYQYFALNNKSGTYIPINPETLNKCKTLRKLTICKETEPPRVSNSGTPCEIKLANNSKFTDLSGCSVKITKLEETFWARTNTSNVWIFSTDRRINLIYKCRRESDRIIIISGKGTARLPTGCTAYTGDVQLTAGREISSTSSFNFTHEASLNISQFLNQTNAEINEDLQQILAGEKGTHISGEKSAP